MSNLLQFPRVLYASRVERGQLERAPLPRFCCDELAGRLVELSSVGGTASLKVAARRSVSGVISLSGPVSFRGLDVGPDMGLIDEPKLFLASEGDAPALQSLEVLSGGTREPRETLVLTGDAHGTDMLKGAIRQRVEDAILGFLERW